MARKRSRKVLQTSKPSSNLDEQLNSNTISVEAGCFISMLKQLSGAIEGAMLMKGSLPEKIWIKQQFSIGLNDVTRSLERMPAANDRGSALEPSLIQNGFRPPSISLQAVILATNCGPRWLSKHLPDLACSRGVPLIQVKDNRAASLRLGELVKMKTAMAIGVKAKGTEINRIIEEIVDNKRLDEIDENSEQVRLTVCTANPILE